MTPPELVETDDFINETLDRPLQIVFRDENFVAVFKPAGLIVHRCKSSQAHEPALLQTLRYQLHRHVFPVHRLDRPTAGLMLFGLSGVAAAKMVDLFTRRMVAKYYQALVCGSTPETALIDKPLSDKSEDDWENSDCHDTHEKDAMTKFQTLARFELPAEFAASASATNLATSKPSLVASTASAVSSFSLLEIKPLTGRTHQIRRHLSYIGHPIVGDYRHGDIPCNKLVLAKTGVCRMLLTSMRLDFRHPYSGELQTIVVGRGSEFDLALSKMRNPMSVNRTALPVMELLPK